MLLVICAVSATLIVFALMRWASESRSTWRDLHTLTMTAFALSVSAIYGRSAIDDATGVPNLGHLLSHLVLMTTATCANAYSLFVRNEEPPRSAVIRRLLVGTVISLAALVVGVPLLWVARTDDLTAPNVVQISWLHLALYYVWIGIALCDLAQRSLPRAFRAWTKGRWVYASAATALGGGSVIVIITSAIYLAGATLTALTGQPALWAQTIGGRTQAIGIMALCIGTGSMLWVSGAERRSQSRSLHQQIEALWFAVTDAAPECHLKPAIDHEDMQGGEYRLQRALTEIADGLRILRLPAVINPSIGAVIESWHLIGKTGGIAIADLLPVTLTPDEEVMLYVFLSDRITQLRNNQPISLPMKIWNDSPEPVTHR